MPITQQNSPAYVNVLDYNADKTGATDSTSAFASAISALPSTGGTVFIPAGTYTANISVSSLTDITFLGTGTGTVIEPTSTGTAFSITGCTRVSIKNLKIDGSVHGGATGLSINGDFDSRFQNLFITGHTGDGIYVQGDSATGLELSFMQVTCRGNGGWGYHHVRTTNVDRGGVYLTNFRTHYDTQGAGGINLDGSASATSVPAFHWMTNITIDGYTTSAALFQIHNIHGIRVDGLWDAGTSNGAGVLLLDGDGYSNEFIHSYFLNNSTVASSYDVVIGGTQHDNYWDDVSFDCTSSLTAYVNHASTGANNNFYFITTFNNRPMSDTMSALYKQTVQPLLGPVMFETQGSGTNVQSLGIDDAANAGKQKWIRNSNGSLQFLNTAFSSVLARIDDGGFIMLGGGVMINGNTAGACTLWSGSGAPGTGLGSVGDYYFRSDTPTNPQQTLYVKTASATWTSVLAPVQSASAATIANNGTISTAGLDVSRVTCTAARTGAILQAGTYGGQTVKVINESANTITFAVAGTSFVADGTSDVLAATSVRTFVWDSGTSLWYPSK